MFFCEQVLFDKKRAVAVLYTKDGKDATVKAKKEVIVSAGTVGTTKLLLLSGVGPRSHLQSLKVRLRNVLSCCCSKP